MNLLHLLVVTICVHPTLSADGCGSSWDPVYGGASVKCGDYCTGQEGYCTCGENNKKFDYRDNTTWCCNASQCQKDDDYFGIVTCKVGTPLPLTTPCEGKCNDHRSYYAGRHYWGCAGGDQCIKIQHVQDKTHHCKDRSDERKNQEALIAPIVGQTNRVWGWYTVQ